MVVEIGAARVSENKIFASGEIIFGQGDLSWSCLIGQFGSEVKVYSGC
jgi:hypothetical protein